MTFGIGGYPLEKGSKKVPKAKAGSKSKHLLFCAGGSIWTPLKKHEILRHPQNGPKAALGRPKGPKDAQKRALYIYFWYLFGVPCQQWKLCSRVGGSLVYEVPGYSKTAHFSLFFGVRQKEPPGNHFWRTFWDLGGFLRIFRFPLGSHSDYRLLKFVLKITAAKKLIFWGGGGRGREPQVRI